MTGLVSPGHLVILLIVLLLVFGTKRLPELGRSLGSGMREFKDAITGNSPEESPPELPPAEPPVATTATPSEHETTV